MSKRIRAVDRIAEKIVDDLERECGVAWDGAIMSRWDHDKARKIIARSIPESEAEREMAFEDAMNEAENVSQRGPGPCSIALGRMRKVLHADGLSIKCVLEAAADRLEGQVRSKPVDPAAQKLINKGLREGR